MSITVKNLHKDLAEDQLHEAKGFTTASNNTYLKKNHEGSSEWLSEYWLQPVLGVVTGASAPPTESSGDRYILTGSSFDAGWDSPSQHEIVEYNGTTWVGIAAVDGMRVVDLSNDSVYYFNTAWNQVTDANTDTTYSISAVDSGDDAIIRLTAGGSGSGTDDVTLVAGSNITLTPSGDNITIASTASGGASALGDLSDATTPATSNVGIGTDALSSIASGGNMNTAVGVDAGKSLTTGDYNCFFGFQAGELKTGTGNIGIGYKTFENGTGGNYNTAIGYSSMQSATGTRNVALGASAGDGLSSGGYNIMIGDNSDGLNTGSYQIAIGATVATTQASSLILGRSGQILLHGDFATAGQTKLGINLGNTWTAPTASLHVKGQGTGTDTALLVEDSAGDDLLKVLDNGSVTVNNAYTLPTAVTGANDYVLTAQTDGSTAWAAVSGGGGASVTNDLTDIECTGTGAAWNFFKNGATADGAAQHGTLSTAQRNLALGAGGLGSLTSGDDNISIGYYSGFALNTGLNNIMVGYQSAKKLQSGQKNIAIGLTALHENVSASHSVAIGTQALYMTTGYGNVGIGNQAGRDISSGIGNVVLGYSVNGGSVPTTGDKNIVLGFMVGVPDPTADGQFVVGHCHTNPHYLLSGNFATSNQSKLGINLGATGTGNARAAVAPTATLEIKGQGTTHATTNLLIKNSGGSQIMKLTDSGDSIAIGKNALDTITSGSGSFNIGIGTDAGTSLTTGDNNVCIGQNAGEDLVTNSNNVLIGYNAGTNLTANASIMIGYRAGESVTSGTGNIFMGYDAGKEQTENGSTAIGYEAARNINGRENTVLGYNALKGNGSSLAAWRNTAIGYESLKVITTGDNNIAIGLKAGDNLTTGSNNILIGDEIDASAVGVDNELNIGNTVRADMSAGELFLSCPSAAPADGDLNNNECSFFVDSSTFKVKYKDNSGTVTTFTLS